MRMKVVLAVVGAVAGALAVLIGCSALQESNSASSSAYRQITQEEARSMMQAERGYVIVDVRRQDEYASGHIPGAICIPNESIDAQRPEELPDLGQLIMVYCRSGNRSKQAARKLADMGYTNVVEFGGINTWPGEVVTE